MDVTFVRTGERRYATVVARPGEAPLRMEPAPGYDDEIPHDLVHYLVEAEVGLARGVYGRAAAGGGDFRPSDAAGTPRERARERRRRERRAHLVARADRGDMARSEHLAGLCDVAWRRRTGAATPAWAGRTEIPADDARIVERVLEHLARIAPRWSELPVGGALTFTWPDTAPL